MPSGTSSVKEWPGPAVGSASMKRIDSPCLITISVLGLSSGFTAKTVCSGTGPAAGSGVRSMSRAAKETSSMSGRHLFHHLGPVLPGLLDRALVLDGGDVADVLARRHGLEHPPHDLAAAGLRQHGDEVAVGDH